jgi:uncharacterized protein with HEPN domain
LPSDKPARRLEDIIENVQAIQRYVAGMDVTAFKDDQKTYDAVERCLERISEAAAKLGALAPSLVPGQPWQEIRALGNRLRHEYDAIREDRLWDKDRRRYRLDFVGTAPLLMINCVSRSTTVSSGRVSAMSMGVLPRASLLSIGTPLSARNCTTLQISA